MGSSEPRSGAAWAVGSEPALRGASRRRARPAAWRALLLAAALGCAVAAGACRPVNPSEDTRIEGEIKARLVAEKNANLTRLGVISKGGVVSLSGTVASTEEKARAEAVSRTVRGVERIVNRLEVLGE